eukprot:TRINITY_DN308_c0_g1_i1.p1 TRINITY_DN308_c0_g1~~TRINITY_DN308_c0_g1_i1.p1  ORF type:complete len:245 (+),score=38.96 TRINITY_DN308_c0_g1_i1:347-1081(+)
MTSMSETLRSPKQPDVTAESETDAKLMSSSVPISPPSKPKSTIPDNRVKMKYFQSLGMNHPPQPSNHSGSMAHSVASSSMAQIKRERGKTAPMMTVGFDIPATPEKIKDVASSEGQGSSITHLGHRKKRSISVPDMFSAQVPAAIPIPVRGALGEALRNHQVDSDDESFPSSDSVDSDAENEDGSPNSGDQDVEVRRRSGSARKSKQFVPPHEMLAQNGESFEVGTARSLALWETRRRAKMNVI